VIGGIEVAQWFNRSKWTRDWPLKAIYL